MGRPTGQQALCAGLKGTALVKLIAGIANLDEAHVGRVAEAARLAGAPALDVAAAMVPFIRSRFEGILFASSVEPQALAQAVRDGADVAELGNFDALYADGAFFSANTVLQLAKETMAAVRAVSTSAAVCVTIPGHLDTAAQQALAKDLEALGVDLLQTEGAVRLLSGTAQVKTLSPEEQVALTLTNTRVLTAVTTLPVMTATGMTATSAPHAVEAGARAVGIGRAVSQLATVEDMTLTLKAVITAVAAVSETVALSA